MSEQQLRATAAREPRGDDGGWQLCPTVMLLTEVACVSGDGGSRIVASYSTDLAKFAIGSADRKRDNQSRSVSEDDAEMLTPVKEEAGLGFFMEKDNPDNLGTTEPMKDFSRHF